MNYFSLLKAFWDLLKCEYVAPNAQLLYYTLLQINNECHWATYFKRTNQSLCDIMKIGESSFVTSRNTLKQLNLIDFVSTKKRGECTQYRILYPTNQGTTDGTTEVQPKYNQGTTEVQPPDIIRHRQRHRQRHKQIHTTPTPSDDQSNLFCRFWSAYPKKVGKGNCEKWFSSHKPSNELVTMMCDAIDQQKQSDQWSKDNGKFVPYPYTWLNGQRWEDELKQSPESQNASNPSYDLEILSQRGMTIPDEP